MIRQTQAMTPPNVSIIVVNWNGAKILPRCLAAITKQTFKDYEVIVVDNASEDGSADGIEENWPAIKVIRLKENRGFAAANNLGARKAQGRWLALLNNDAFPKKDWLENLLTAAQSNQSFSFFASCLIQANAPEYLDSSGDICHISGLAWNRGRGRSIKEAGLNKQSIESNEVFSPCAAAGFYLRADFLQAGGFDENYFSHHEDVDLGFRMRLLGLRCLYVPDAVAEHVGSASFGGEGAKTIYQTHRNMVWTYLKNMPGNLVWRYLPAHLLANLVFLVYYSLNGQAKAIWQAKWDAWRGFGRVIRQRKEIQKRRQAHPDAIRKVLDHRLLSPYTLGKNAEIIQSWARRTGLNR
jgi:GT2 family glycosyltransferase